MSLSTRLSDTRAFFDRVNHDSLMVSAYELLMSRNPGDVQSQVFSAVPRWRLAGLDPPRARNYLEAALAILKPLAETNRLDANRLQWIPAIAAQLAALQK